MKYNNVKDALEEAERFAAKAVILLDACDAKADTVGYGGLSASVRRSSLDLTKSLSKMRKSDYGETYE